MGLPRPVANEPVSGGGESVAGSQPGLARYIYLDAISAATFAGRLATPGGSVAEVAQAAAHSAAPRQPPRAPDSLLTPPSGALRSPPGRRWRRDHSCAGLRDRLGPGA